MKIFEIIMGIWILGAFAGGVVSFFQGDSNVSKFRKYDLELALFMIPATFVLPFFLLRNAILDVKEFLKKKYGY